MTCDQCGAPCQGGLCKQCEVEAQFAHLTDELARDDGDADSEAFGTAEPRDARDDAESGHSARLAQLTLAAENGTLPDHIDAPEEVRDDE